ncbi:COG1361 family protein [Thalassoroseus pseudoceratinae]|uniref:DUF11 domain-containing protein n=1 Tax=Thalassoroseus pseudoceratinae TaxID=2713176 RepID=UPI001422B053|nr:DUF11 domain-containing protein [Thalassoroseus pseudoceratinae]
MKKVGLVKPLLMLLVTTIAWPLTAHAQFDGKPLPKPEPSSNPFAAPIAPPKKAAPTSDFKVPPAKTILPTVKKEAAKLPAQPSSTVRINALGPSIGMNVTPRDGSTPYVKTFKSQIPSLSVDWVTPEAIMVGAEDDFELVLRNRGAVTIEQVAIDHVLPTGFELINSRPRPEKVGDDQMWMVEKIEPNEEVRIALRLKPVKAGPAESHARVTYSTTANTKFEVIEPKLTLAADGSETVVIGNQAIMNIVIENPGTGPTTNTLLKVAYSEGLRPLAKGTTYEIGTLNPGESRSVRVLADVTKLGEHLCTFTAVADHGLKAEQTRKVQGIGAVLAMEIDGPGFRYVNRPATFEVKVVNKGTAPADNVHIRCAVPRSFGFLGATDFGKFDAASKTVNWFVNQIPPGKEVVVKCDLKALDRGEFPLLAAAKAERGLTCMARHATTVEGIAAILLEVVDIDDPVEVGAETAYEILITNQGTDYATNVQIKLDVPDGMEITNSRGPTKATVKGQTVFFGALPKLAPRADAIYRVNIKGTKPGDFRVSVQAQSDTLRSPVVEQESTKVYQDQ